MKFSLARSMVLPVLFAACAAQQTSAPPVPPAAFASGHAGVPLRPALVTLDSVSHALEYWDVALEGGSDPKALSKPLSADPGFVSASYGTTIVMLRQQPPGVVLFDLSTMRQRALPDPYGTPIDAAVDAQRDLYVLNLAGKSGNVAYYSAKALQPHELACSKIGEGEAIAVDHEGNAFINGYPPDGAAGVVEILSETANPGPRPCMRRKLRAEPGYVAGIAVDPKTQDLIVLDDPDDCAGGIEGRMTIYPRPYRPSTATVRELGATCAGLMRLNATSTTVFFSDQTVSGGIGFVAQRTYPGGAGSGIYRGGHAAGFAAFPSALP